MIASDWNLTRWDLSRSRLPCRLVVTNAAHFLEARSWRTASGDSPSEAGTAIPMRASGFVFAARWLPKVSPHFVELDEAFATLWLRAEC
jgi:hypothetical protein